MEDLIPTQNQVIKPNRQITAGLHRIFDDIVSAKSPRLGDYYENTQISTTLVLL